MENKESNQDIHILTHYNDFEVENEEKLLNQLEHINDEILFLSKS